MQDGLREPLVKGSSAPKEVSTHRLRTTALEDETVSLQGRSYRLMTPQSGERIVKTHLNRPPRNSATLFQSEVSKPVTKITPVVMLDCSIFGGTAPWKALEH